MIFSLSRMLTFVQLMNTDGYCGIDLGKALIYTIIHIHWQKVKYISLKNVLD